MKSEAFWPEVNIDDYMANAEGTQEEQRSEDKGKALMKFEMVIPTFNIVCLHKGEQIYLIHLDRNEIEFYSYLRDSVLKVKSMGLKLYNIADIAGAHKVLVQCKPSNRHAFMLEMNMFGRYKSLVNNFSTQIGIRLSGVKVIFLKKVVQELV